MLDHQTMIQYNIIFIPFLKLNLFVFIFFLEVLYWQLLIINLICPFYPLLISLRIISFSAVEGATLFSFVIFFISKIKKKIF